MADYRSAVQHIEQAKLRSVERGNPWAANVQFALEKVVERASNRGAGAARASGRRAPPQQHTRTSAWPMRADVAGSWWACRSIELANAVVTDVAILANGEVSWELPSSKTGQAALGASRAHRCSCGYVAGAPTVAPQDTCPRCVLAKQVAWVCDAFETELDNGKQIHVFPTTTGDFIAKANVVKHIELGATSLGKPTRSRTGAYLWGGRAYRRGILTC
jgi:hypothetical protein